MDIQTARDVYSKRAARYALSANLYKLIGLRVDDDRRKAVQALNLQAGDKVLVMNCGTGLNLPFLQDAVGRDGEITGVDLTPDMLAQAETSVEAAGWSNVELVQADVSRFGLPQGVAGILSTFALSIIPEYEAVIGKSAQALTARGQLVILDLRLVTGLPRQYPVLYVLDMKNLLPDPCATITELLTGAQPRCLYSASKVKKKHVPWPGTLSTPIRPPCASTIPRAMAKPKPAPPVARLRDFSPR